MSYIDLIGYKPSICIGLFVATFLWEYIMLKKNTVYKPSALLGLLADVAADIFKSVGSFIALVSSFYELIDFADILATFEELISPSVRLIMSPFWLMIGYVQRSEVYKHPWLIFAGSVTLASLFVYMVGLRVIFDYTLYKFHTNIVVPWAHVMVKGDPNSTIEKAIPLTYLLFVVITLGVSVLGYAYAYEHTDKEVEKKVSTFENLSSDTTESDTESDDSDSEE